MTDQASRVTWQRPLRALQGSADDGDLDGRARRPRIPPGAEQRLAGRDPRNASVRLGAGDHRSRPDARRPAGRHRPLGARRRLARGRAGHPHPERERRRCCRRSSPSTRGRSVRAWRTASWSVASASTRSSPPSERTHCCSAPSSASRAASREPQRVCSARSPGAGRSASRTPCCSPRNPRAGHAPGQEDGRRTPLRSRRSEPGRRAGHRPAVPHAPRRGYVWCAAALRHRRHPARGHHAQPTAFQGNSYLLTSVAVVVLGGTSLLGGAASRGHRCRGPLPESARPVRARPGCAVRGAHPGQAAALAIGVAVYTVDWAAVRRRFVPSTEEGAATSAIT